VKNRNPIQITNIYSMVTVSMMGPMGPSRMTALEYPDLQNEKPLESMMILPAAWYKMSDEQAEMELKDLKDSMEKAKEYRDEMEKRSASNLVQARLQPTFGGSPTLGGLVGMKPPGLR
jgi:hypothetical protein